MIGWAWPVIAQFPIQLNIPSYNDNFIIANSIPYGYFNPCSCVSYSKFLLNIPQEETWGNASQIMPWYLEPKDHGLVITREGGGHVAYYERSGIILTLYEANYIPCQVSTRELMIGDLRIKGYR